RAGGRRICRRVARPLPEAERHGDPDPVTEPQHDADLVPVAEPQPNHAPAAEEDDGLSGG
ncbi:hypothetical protein A2U01_0081591, partial [Trifolium medium]|nr:hypothetical protein [Trifolium medium]